MRKMKNKIYIYLTVFLLISIAQAGASGSPEPKGITVPYYKPLEDVLIFDKFDTGLQGWSLFETYGQEEATLVPKLINDSLSGDKSVQIQKTMVKRLTWLKPTQIRWEFWWKWHTPISQKDLDFVQFWSDTQQGWCDYEILKNETDCTNVKRNSFVVRWINYEGRYIKKWQYIVNDQWVDFPGDPYQELTWNNPYRTNWIYSRLDFDLKTEQYLEFQSNDRIWKLSGSPGQTIVEPGCNNLLNFIFTVKPREYPSSQAYPAYIQVDSTIVSTDLSEYLLPIDFTNRYVLLLLGLIGILLIAILLKRYKKSGLTIKLK